MASTVLTAVNPTLLDLAKRQDPDGSIAAIAEILDQTSEMLIEMSWVEGNLQTGHRVSIRTGIPLPTWRKIGGGVQRTKSTTAQVTFATGMLEAYSEPDKALADLGGNRAEFLLSEARPHIAGMGKELQDTLIFGNESTEPEAFTGLAPHYNSLSAESGDNIIVGGGSGSDNASIWLVVWSPETIFGIIPQGSTAGLQVHDKGQVTIEDADGAGGRMEAYRVHFKWDAGLVVKDWRFAVRIPNIDKSLLTRVYKSTDGDFSTGANLPDLMFQAMRLVPNLSMGRASFYMSRDIATWVSRQTMSIGGMGGLITTDMQTADASDVAGKQRFTERFHGIPMRRVDSLAADEAEVT